MMSMLVREAAVSDLESIVELYDDSLDGETRPELIDAVVKGELPGHRAIVALENDTILGFLLSRLVSGQDEIIMLVIARDHFGRGVGAALLQDEQEHASRNKAVIMRMIDRNIN